MKWASRRDASWVSELERPNKYHVRDVLTGFTGLCGVVLEDQAIPFKEVPKTLRCQHPACKKAWKEK